MEVKSEEPTFFFKLMKMSGRLGMKKKSKFF